MKKLLALVVTIVLLVSTATIGVFAADNLTIDLSKAVAKAGFTDNSPAGLWPAAGYTDKYVLGFCNYGAYASIGSVDLSKYQSVVVTYARSVADNYDGKATKFAFTKNGAIQNGQAAIDNATAGVVAEYVFTGSVEGSWQGQVDETIAISSTYSGEIFVANYLDPTNTNGFVITNIEFIAKGASNPQTLDIGFMSIAVMSLVGLAVTKKRK